MRLSKSSTARLARFVAVGALASCSLSAAPRPLEAQGRAVVYVVPIEGMIDMGLAPFVRRTLDEAEREGAAAVIFEINTFGGRVDAAVAIRDALLSAPMPTVAFVNRRAISAGALITLAAERVAMTDGGTVGAAMPVQAGGPDGETSPVDEKSVSYVRKEFRATADARKRPPVIAEAMVDSDVAIAGLVDKGKLLTLTTDEAIEHGIADFRARDIPDLLAHVGLADATVRRFSPNWGERLVRLVTHPILASLLMSLAMLGILIEIRSPGLGLPGALGVGSLVLLLGSHWLVELVGWEEMILVGLGLTLIAVEVFVIPGFGITGIAGGAALLGGLTMGLIGEGATLAAIGGAAARVAISILASVALLLPLLRFLPELPFGRQLMLATVLPPGGGDMPDASRRESWLGLTGRASTPLRPAGIAEFDGERVDVVSEGEMIETGTPVVVCRVDGNRIVVRRHRATMEG